MDVNGNTIARMSSPPCPRALNKLLFETVRHSSESQSEISSVGSDWSDMTNIALQLGITNKEDCANERFKIDRQKLETMIKADSTTEGKNGAEHFFDTIMSTTSTCISWPCRLKIGAKTKKDPHVRILGRPSDVMKAKDRILAALDSRGSRVIMKMDISYTDHSYIIGRGGKIIKNIMEGTLTHIHFPDSNRSNPSEKSNQVSLCGSLEGVEKARSMVRLSAPLIISFELPIMMPGRRVPDNDTQYVKDVEQKFGIQVIFSSRSKLHSSLVLVKGSEKEAMKVQEATQLLINFMCESIANQIHVNLQLEISPHHHEIVRGKNNTQLLSIMERTKTKIIFPDVNDVNIKAIKKSQVTITGSIDGVYKARQQLIGNLPVALIFDYPEAFVEPDDITSLGNKYGVFIALRQKSRQSTLSVVIKGVEKYVDKIYEARHIILNLRTPPVKPEIPKTYFPPTDMDVERAYRQSLSALLSNYPESPLTPGIPFGGNLNSPFGQFKFNNNSMDINMMHLKNLQVSPNTLSRFQHQQHQHQQNNSNFLAPMSMPNRMNLSPSNGNTSGYNSIASSANSVEQLYAPYQPNKRLPSSSPSSRYSPEHNSFMSSSPSLSSIGRRMSDSANSHLFENDCRTPTPTPRLSDYDTKRVEGFKAMERTPSNAPELRTPTNAWAGLSLSKSSPFALEAAGMSHWTHREETTPYKMGATTSMLDTTPVQDRYQLSNFKDIHSLLTHLKLDHYINNFVVNEIDVEIFSTLTSENLIELGISAFGARKKILYAINQLNSERSMSRPPLGFSGSAAPGAERRPSGW